METRRKKQTQKKLFTLTSGGFVIVVKNNSFLTVDSIRLVTVLGNKGLLKFLNGTKVILDDHGNILDSSRISLESFRSFRDPLLLKPVTGQELFFAVSYSKPALATISKTIPEMWVHSTSPMPEKHLLNSKFKGRAVTRLNNLSVPLPEDWYLF